MWQSLKIASGILLLLVVHPTFASTASAGQTSILTALSALGGTRVQGATFSGTVESSNGEAKDEGTFSAECAVGGASQFQAQLGSASIIESRQTASGIASGRWTDEKGEAHPIAGHNLYTPECWLSPALTLIRILTATNLNIQNSGSETKDGANVAHFAIDPLPRGTDAASVLWAHLNHMDVYLDPVRHLPVAFEFNVHPDNDATTDIPIEIRFSEYAQVSGVWTPSRVQRYINHSLMLDLKIQTVQFR